MGVIHDSDYAKYRGRCKKMSEELIASRPDLDLRLVRGFYYEPIWGTLEQHWWCVAPDGTIHDPTKDQFPTKGNSFYEEFDGFMEREECGKRIAEADIIMRGNYPVCSNRCAMRLVGL